MKIGDSVYTPRFCTVRIAATFATEAEARAAGFREPTYYKGDYIIIVGGLIQPVYPFDDPVALICNDEGKLMNLPANRGLRGEDGQIYDIICGTFFLCGASSDSDSFTSLTQEQVERYRERFYTPEMFWGVGGRIVCLPLEVD